MKKIEKFSNILEKFDEARNILNELRDEKDLSDEQKKDLNDNIIFPFTQLFNELMNYIKKTT